MSLREYLLAPHVHVCVSPEGAVFLDLGRDAYVGVAPALAHSLSQVVEGWPAGAAAPSPENDPRILDANSVADSLCARGLLVRAPATGRTAQAPRVVVPREELVAWEDMGSDHITFAHCLEFLRAFVCAKALLRFTPLEKIVCRQQRRLERHLHTPLFDLQHARSLTSAYQHVRTWVFRRKGNCMLDSLAMLEFLARYGVHPSWVIGVQVRPFAAHTWLQHEHWVLNGTPSFVRAYRPIFLL